MKANACSHADFVPPFQPHPTPATADFCHKIYTQTKSINSQKNPKKNFTLSRNARVSLYNEAINYNKELTMRNMKRKIVSVVIAFFAMAVTCAAAFADTVTFDKKNKGNEKDFVTFEFRSSTELASLCKKYPKNNAEILIQEGAPLGKIPVSNNSDAEFFSIIKCFPGAEFDMNLFTNSGVRLNADSDGTTFENDALIEFKYDGKAYSLSKVTGLEPNVISFFKFDLKDRYYYNFTNEFITDLLDGFCNAQKYEFRSVKEFEKLQKKHKDELFCVIIPAGSKIRTEKELEKLSKLIFNDSKTIKKKYDSYFSSNSTVVIEPLNMVPLDESDSQSFIDQTISSLSSVSKDSRKFDVCSESDSTVIKFEKAILNLERERNKAAGLGNITNAEAEKERKQNEASGNGRITNAELAKKLENERAANEKAGLGKITNEEVKNERKQNEAAGYGRLTNAEVEEERKQNEAAGNGAITNAELLEIQGTGSKACSVYFFDFEVKDKAEWNVKNFPEGNAKTRMETALENRKQYNFNLLTTLKKLDKGHEKESISITIPVGAKMWNEKDMVALMEYFYNDTSKAQEYVNKFIMPKIKENKPVIFERYVYEGNRYYSIFLSQSLADKFEAEKEKERIANEAAGHGRITNAELAEKLENERKTNEKAGLGKLTNEEVEKERKQNKAAGYGFLTNTELAKKLEDEKKTNEKAGLADLQMRKLKKNEKRMKPQGVAD